MEHTGVTPRGAVVAPDLAELLQAPGPFVTVYLTTESGIDNASHRSEQRWKPLRRQLADAGAPEQALAAVDPLVPDAHLEGETLAVIANGNGLLHVTHGPEPPPRDEVHVGPVPRLLPLLALRQSFPPHVAVLADRTGADLFVSRLEGPDVRAEAGGDDYPLTRVNAGGWSQLRYQHRAENTWQGNAEDVAAAVARLVGRFGARLVVVAGDVRAVELLTKALPDGIVDRLAVVDGGRSDDGSEALFAERVQEQLTAYVNSDTADLLGKFREELGEGDRAADGPAATLGALAGAQAEVLLVIGRPDDPRVAFFGPEPNQVGQGPEEVRAMGVDAPAEAPLVDVAVRAALGTGAGVRIVPDGDLPTGGLGAILRWS